MTYTHATIVSDQVLVVRVHAASHAVDDFVVAHYPNAYTEIEPSMREKASGQHAIRLYGFDGHAYTRAEYVDNTGNWTECTSDNAADVSRAVFRWAIAFKLGMQALVS